MIHTVNKIDNSISYSKQIYNDLLEKYLGKNLKKGDLKDINKEIASIHWLLSHAVPYERGSDCITNAFIKSLYGALGIKTSPPKGGISFDLEAFCTEYKQYIKNYSDFYEMPPQIIA